MTLEESREKIITSAEALCDAAEARDLMGVIGHGSQLLDAAAAFAGPDGERLQKKLRAFFEKLDSDPAFAEWVFDLAKMARTMLGSAPGAKRG